MKYSVIRDHEKTNLRGRKGGDAGGGGGGAVAALHERGVARAAVHLFAPLLDARIARARADRADDVRPRSGDSRVAGFILLYRVLF